MNPELPTQPSFQDSRGVSNVIGVILMVAITVLLAIVIALFVLGQGTPEVAPNAQTTIEYPSSGEATITLEQTDSNKELHVVANDATHGTVTTSGDSVTVTGLSDGDTIRVMYYGEEQSYIVDEHEYDYSSTGGGASVSFTCDASTGQLVVSKSAGSDNCEFATIQNAVDNASSGDTIQVYDGTYDENTLVIDKQVTITGETQSGVVITASTPQTCTFDSCNVHVTAPGVSIDTLTIESSNSNYGILNSGSNIYLADTTHTSAARNTILSYGGGGTLTQSTIKDARAQLGAGSVISDNTATAGAILTGGGDSTLRNNTAKNGAGLSVSTGSTPALIEENTITNTESGIYVGIDGTTVPDNVVTGTEFEGINIQANNTVVEYNTVKDGTGSNSVGIEVRSGYNDNPTTGNTIRNNKVLNHDTNIRLHGIETEKYDAADTQTVRDNIIYGESTYAAGDTDDSAQTNADTGDLQQNYWGHNDGAATNSDCTPDSTRLRNDIDASNALCTAPTAGAR
jgi:flagellin-like protein